MWQKKKLLVLSNFFFCYYVFKKPSAAEASEIIYMRERVKKNCLDDLKVVCCRFVVSGKVDLVKTYSVQLKGDCFICWQTINKYVAFTVSNNALNVSNLSSAGNCIRETDKKTVRRVTFTSYTNQIVMYNRVKFIKKNVSLS